MFQYEFCYKKVIKSYKNFVWKQWLWKLIYSVFGLIVSIITNVNIYKVTYINKEDIYLIYI